LFKANFPDIRDDLCVNRFRAVRSGIQQLEKAESFGLCAIAKEVLGLLIIAYQDVAPGQR
jgi:hypothetical protein